MSSRLSTESTKGDGMSILHRAIIAWSLKHNHTAVYRLGGGQSPVPSVPLEGASETPLSL
jgi:hypothetical protein